MLHRLDASTRFAPGSLQRPGDEFAHVRDEARNFDSRGTDANFETHSFHMVEKEEKWGYAQ